MASRRRLRTATRAFSASCLTTLISSLRRSSVRVGIGRRIVSPLVAGFSLWEFHRATAHLIPPLPGLNPNFATQYAIYVLKVKQAIFDEYHLIFRATAIALFIGALLAALTLRPLPRPRWR